jgi:hypothetical protein
MQGNRSRASRLGAVGVGAERERRTGDAIRRGGPAGGYADVPAVFYGNVREQRRLSREKKDLRFVKESA